jgi:Tfp pilus assembly protein PilX
MKSKTGNKAQTRQDEKGAALVMTLMISSLLLIASVGLIMETSRNSLNVTDGISEQQAFNAAESGIQSAVHVLRCQKNTVAGCGDVVANPLLNTTLPATDPANQINYRRALDMTTSNVGGDTSGAARLSRWIGYNGTDVNGRVPIDSNGPTYTTSAGYAYSLAVTDPDNTGNYVSATITGKFNDYDSVATPAQKTYYQLDSSIPPAITGSLRITYTPPPTLNMWNLATTPMPSPYYGTFTVTRPLGSGAVIPANNRFEITVRMTYPYIATKTIRGFIRTTTNPTDLPHIIFDSQTLTLAGSAMTLDFSGTSWVSPTVINYDPITPPPLVGYDAGTVLGPNIIKGTMSSPEPIRLLIKSTGYGPRGAKKELQAIIQKNFFNGLTSPAALLLVGPNHTDSPLSDFHFEAGSSAVVKYSGDDEVSTDIIPPIGTTNVDNQEYVDTYLTGFHGNVVGTASNVTNDVPYWLQTPANLDAEIQRFAMAAMPYRYFASGVVPDSFGDNATGQGLTFCDGDLEFSQYGGGILVVTGHLTLKGDFNFRGLIIVTGAGGIDRNGGGGGTITGNVIVAPYVSSKVSDTQAVGSDFLAPYYDLNGGGNSTLVYNSSAINNGLSAVSNFVLGVMEK